MPPYFWVFLLLVSSQVLFWVGVFKRNESTALFLTGLAYTLALFALSIGAFAYSDLLAAKP